MHSCTNEVTIGALLHEATKPNLGLERTLDMSSTILITGTSSGFGKLASLTLARRGHTVFASMRDPGGKNREVADELRRTAEADKLALHVIELDVTSDASVERAVAGVLAAGRLDVVVNNAGYGVGGLAETASSAQFLAELDTNVVGMQRVNRAVLPSMRANRAGLLVHVSSGLGRLVFPFLGVYTATKWAVEALAEAYRYELKPTGVDSTIVQPGAFPTNFGGAMQIGADQDRAAGYGPLAQGLQRFGEGLEQMFKGPDAPNPQEVVDAIVDLIEAPAGKRPARVVVDRINGQGPTALNEAHATVQRAALGAMGMGSLAD
jgi:NAD(P)-dependent dehydrogenase (short-subunit alcohol dehydrogenase family)